MRSFRVWAAISGVAVLIAAGSAISGAPADVRVFDVNGRVQLRPQGGEWRLAREDERLPEGSEVLTENDGSCQVAFDADGTGVVLVKNGTHAMIVSTDPARVNLTAGGLMAYVKGLKKGSTFSVGTPAAVASVRGSGFGIDLASDGRQTSLAFDDTLRIESSGGGTLDVPEGKGVDLSNGVFGDTFDIPEDARSEWQGFRDEAADPFDSGFSEADNIEKNVDRPDTTSETRDIKADDRAEAKDKLSTEQAYTQGGG